MLSVQLGSALSVGLVAAVGPAGVAWLRLSFGALVFLVLTRPPLRSIRRIDLGPLLALGIATGLVTTAFLSAIQRIPLGTAVAIEFLGPLTIAAVRSPTRGALVWPALALVGVLLVSRPWAGTVNLTGVGFAVLAAVGWAVYILLTQRVGDRFTGIGGLSLTVPIAAVTAGVAGIPQATGHLTYAVLAAAAGLALLLPVLPFGLEMLALRHMTSTAFGTLMSLEPAIGAVVGAWVLRQQLMAGQLAGIALVVVAGFAAQRNGRRKPPRASPSRATC